MKVKSSWNKVISFMRMLKESYHYLVIILIGGGLLKASLPFLGLYFSAKILNNLIARAYQDAINSVLVMLISQLIVGLIVKVCDQRIQLVRENSDSAVKQRIAAKAFEMEYERFEKQETLDDLRKANLSVQGMGGIGDQIFDLYSLIETGFSILYSIIFTIMLFLQVDSTNKSFFNSYYATILLVLIYVGFIMLYVLADRKVLIIFNNMAKNNDHLNSIWGYMTSLAMEQKNAKDVRIYNMQDTLDKKMKFFEDEAIGGYKQVGIDTARYYALNSFLSQIASGITYVFIGAKALYGVIPIGNVILYAGAINRVVTSFMTFTQTLHQFLYRGKFLDTYTEFLERPSMSYDGTLPIEKRNDGRYIFEFHDVSFSYPDTNTNQEILSHVNLTFKVGEKLAIVGQNGAGKTTIIKLLCRLYEPTGGMITLNGIDIKKYSYKEYVQVFSVVFQDFKIFSLQLDENIAGEENADKEKLWSALKEVDLKERVENMEQKEKSQLYNNNGEGVDVSGGEAQRLAIARALYKDAPFVILDEPTAALDPIAEANIYENFNNMIKNKTAIYISHRMSSCKFCDRIVVLNKGVVSEQGTHDELISLQGIYANLYETQAKYYI